MNTIRHKQTSTDDYVWSNTRWKLSKFVLFSHTSPLWELVGNELARIVAHSIRGPVNPIKVSATVTISNYNED